MGSNLQTAFYYCLTSDLWISFDPGPGNFTVLRNTKIISNFFFPVASKHKETKQYYIFYNTLYEVKLYTSKELSLLNSILDNYDE